MRAHYLQHVFFEGLGSIEPWLRQTGYEISSTRFFDSEILPEINDIDFLIVMGGPMSVNDEDEYPWLAKEKEFIRKAIEANKVVLGVCLGAQLIADAMGAKVYPHVLKEIGWFAVEGVRSQGISVFQFPEKIEAFHWHGETFDLPKGAVHIAKSKGCMHQAFQIGSNVMGLQFHLETMPTSARSLVEHCSHELVEGEFIQTKDQILSADQKQYASINHLMESVLGFLHATHR